MQVVWVDSCLNTDQMPRNDARKAKPVRIFSYGMVVKQTKKRITLALDYHTAHDDVRLCITIPMCSVLSIAELRKVK